MKYNNNIKLTLDLCINYLETRGRYYVALLIKHNSSILNKLFTVKYFSTDSASYKEQTDKCFNHQLSLCTY